jgi:MFS transporter, OPA family, glycerol-3-phosphate transporter
MPTWLSELLAIGGLLVAVAIVLGRLPKVELGHSEAFRRRRILNWLPLGLTYAFLYWGRYNLDVAKGAGLMDKEALGIVTMVGTWVYGVSFLINGPLADKFGGRKTILWAAAGACVANLLMGLLVWTRWEGFAILAVTGTAPSGFPIIGGPTVVAQPVPDSMLWFSLLYGLNMYFQSFGAVSIVKVNAAWFHVRERGTFGGIFGILISLGIYFAFDWSRLVISVAPTAWVFLAPTIALAVFFVVDYFLVFDSPGDVGHRDFDTADASSGDDGPRLPVWQVAKRMFSNPIILTIALIELTSGFVRGAVMKWSYLFLKETGQVASFIFQHWGMVLCVAGILGGVFAGTVSDRLFQSRRGPSAVMLYGLVTVTIGIAGGMIISPAVGWIFAISIMAIIGVHGMLSGTASMDFGGKKNVGVAVGLIDGFVYLGMGLQSMIFGFALPRGAEQTDPSNWRVLPLIVLPAAFIGFLLSLRIWNARPQPRTVPKAAAAGGPVIPVSEKKP